MKVILRLVSGILLLWLVLDLSFCQEQGKIKEFDEVEVNNVRTRASEYASKMVGTEQYRIIYEQARDSINSWVSNDLKRYSPHRDDSWILDSLICINKTKDKCRMAVMTQCLDSCTMDDIMYFYGVKVQDHWYFFGGPTMYLPREYYQENTDTPLSFKKIQQIATDHIYSCYLCKNKEGEWEIDDSFFSDITSGAWCSTCKTQAEWDSTYLRIIRENWERK